MNNSEWIIRTQSGLVECTRADCKWRCGCVRQKDSRSVASQKKTKKIDNFMVRGSHYEFSVTWHFWSQVTDLSNLGTMVPGDRIFLFFEPGTFWSQVTAYHPILAGFGRPNLKTWLTEKLHKNFLPDNFGLSAGFFEHFFMLDRRIAAWSFR